MKFYTKFTFIVHIHIGDIHFLLFATGEQVCKEKYLELTDATTVRIQSE